MTLILDLAKPVEKASEQHLLALTRALIGKRCAKVEISYGGELVLHLGDLVPCTNLKLKGEQKGSWIFGTRASGWRLLLTDPPILVESAWFPDSFRDATFRDWVKQSAAAIPFDGAEVEERTKQLHGRTVQDVGLIPFRQPPPYPTGIGVVIEFLGGSSLVVVPNPEADDDDPLPDWELFTPFHTYLTVGPGLISSYLPSDVPAKAK